MILQYGLKTKRLSYCLIRLPLAATNTFSFRKTMATCCPPGSLPKLVSDHKQKGTDIDLPGTDLKLYVVGSGDKVILHFYDIWGLNGGRTRFLCDKLSEQGYKVVIPDFYRGKSWDDSPLEPEKVGKFASQFPPEMVVKDAEAVVKYLQEGGAKKFGATASCWGAWALFTCCAHQLPLSACVSYHPALGLAAVFGSTAVELASKVKTAQCLFPAGNDPPDVKPGGEVIKTLEANGVAVECKEYAEVQHGFMPRGDLSDPKVVSACEEAEKLTYEFFSKHL